ncbi:hypothetical protein HH308_06365 [Gordonia sp. TBRC 11910]|uniref:Gp28/Gp37-like domain-containing protein n=1 Tax=Gordonia asplenii TaxID=2725283 RepID=A0A848KQ77_9ACTN|nr:hypothetical protein [Gordonia asplenii]NMO00836.1 hypothetical protein [Gordonia asplenii]
MPPLMSCDQVRSTLQMEYADFLFKARSRPEVILYDKQWDKKLPIVGETQASFIEKLNDTGEGNLVLFATPDQQDFIVDQLGEWEDLHIRVINGFKEWTGKAATISDKGDEEGFEYISIKFLHEYEHIKKIVCFANPLFPAEFQWPKMWFYGGGAVFGITCLIFFNLLRRFALPWTFSDNIFDPASWITNFDPANWPIVVVPKQWMFDTSMWCLLATRFGNCHDVIAPTLKDAGCQVRVYRWFPGMPQPAPDHYTLTRPTLVIDVIDKSGYVGASGTVLDGLAHLITEVADDLINEVVSETTAGPTPEYSIAGFMGTHVDDPWVSWRNAFRTRGISGVKTWEMVRHKATAGAIVTGGKSPEYINAGIKLLMNAALGYLGLLVGNPGLALGIFEDQVEDVILAFHRVPNPIRMDKMGMDGPPYGEYWEASGTTGFSIGALQALRTGFYRTRAYTTFKLEVRSGAPYWPGAHFDVGDRVSGEVGRSRKLYIEHVYSIGQSWSRTEDPDFAISIGDDQVEDTPGGILSRQVAMLKSLIVGIGLSS